MAGASLAAELAPHAHVTMIEAEDRPGYHATGRSAAFWEQCYGGPDIVPLSLASHGFLQTGGFLTQRGALYLARDCDAHAIDEFFRRFDSTEVHIERIGRAALLRHIPQLSRNWTRAIWQPACADIDVAALHQYYLGLAKRGGAVLRLRARLAAADRNSGKWCLTLEDGRELTCDIMVNAAGAWADNVARVSGAAPLGIAPLRRTVMQLRTHPPPRADQPLALDISGRFYFKPEAGRIWLSPHDEVPSPPCDAAPEELDVAAAIERFQNVVDCRIEAVERKWAGLRSFAPDRRPVYGFDPQQEGFFWFAGQGGYGIQTAPAAARLGGQLLLELPRDRMTAPLDAQLYAPDRPSLRAT